MNNKLKIFALAGVLLTSCLVGCGNKEPAGPDYSDHTDLTFRYAKGKNGVVTCANNRVSKIGLDTLKNGGNAFDAAVAMSFGLGLLEPNASGMGGGGVMTGYNAKTGEYVFYNYREFAPENISYELYTDEMQLHYGGLASAVPMQVSGLLDIQEDLGGKTLSLQDLLQPTIDYCDNGYEIDERLFINMSWENIDERGSDEAKALYGYYNEKRDEYSRSKRAGEIVTNTGLGNVLKEIAKSGKDGFYSGWVADAIVESNNAAGGVISKEDLTRAKTFVKKSTPLHSTYNGYDIYTSKQAAAGGIVLSETLNMIESYCKENNKTLKDIGFGTEEFVHLYGTATQLAYADKRYYVADNSINPVTNKPFISVPVDGLISKEYAKARLNSVYNKDKAFIADLNHDFGAATGADPWDYDSVNKDRQEYLYPVNQKDDGTTSLSVVDKDGNICTITQTINTYWGSFVMPKGTGFMLNNEMADFTYDPTSVNRIEPLKCPISSMAPTIIAKDGKNVMSVGCPGSGTIPNALIQVILGVLDFDLDIQQAIEQRRVECIQSNPDDDNFMLYCDNTTKKLIKMEKNAAAWGNDVVKALEDKDYFCAFVEAVTHVYGLTIEYDKNGNVKEYMAGADVRKDGKSLGY